MFKKFFQNKGFHLNGEKRESPVAQQVKDLALSLGLLGSLAWELPHTTGMAKKKSPIILYIRIIVTVLRAKNLEITNILQYGTSFILTLFCKRMLCSY